MISIEMYAELCAAMSDTGGDEAKELEIALSKGVSEAEWKESKSGYTAKMMDAADMGKTAMAFMPLYQAALDKKRGGAEPCPLETYAKVHVHMAYRKDPADSTKKIDYNVVLSEFGYTHQQWIEIDSYWTPRVGAPDQPRYDPVLGAKFVKLADAEHDIIFGIERDANGSAIIKD